MNTTIEFRNTSRIQFRRNLILQAGVLVLCLAAINDFAQTHAVTNCTETALRVAMAEGGTVTFTCDGTITLGNTVVVQRSTTLDASGHQITISGGNFVRVFQVNTNVTFTVEHLIIANGRCTNGAGIYNDGGNLMLLGAVLRSNVVWNGDYVAEGGGIFNRGGTVFATGSVFAGNSANASAPTLVPARGGAIHNNGSLDVRFCTFVGNSAAGGLANDPTTMPSDGTTGIGGAICNLGSAAITDTKFFGNIAAGGGGASWLGWPAPEWSGGSAGGSGGDALGGAVFNAGSATVSDSAFLTNSAVGGAGGAGQPGAAITEPDYTYYLAGGGGGNGGNAEGAALCSTGRLALVGCTIERNATIGAAGGSGADGGPPGPGNGGTGGNAKGAVSNSGDLTMTNCAIIDNLATGAPGGAGGNGAGARGYVSGIYIPVNGATGASGGNAVGAAFNEGSLSPVNCTIAANRGTAGSGGAGGNGSNEDFNSSLGGGNGGNGESGGSGFGGIRGSDVVALNCTIAWNEGQAGQGGNGGAGGSSQLAAAGSPGIDGADGIAGGGIRITAGTLINTLLATNSPANCSGGASVDGGHNLSSDASCSFMSPSSLNSTDPMLAPIADNGGPTLTMALLPGSPAIDAGDDAAAPPTDQRGVARPVGVASDIGAYECSAPFVTAVSPSQTIEAGSSVDFCVGTVGDPALAYLWFFDATNFVVSSTNPDVVLTNLQFSESGIYTVVITNAFGAVTSAPVMLNVIPAVERRPVPGINVTGEPGSLLNVDYANSLSAPPNWLPLDTVSLTNAPQFCVDLTSPMPAQRFYRVWQTGTPGVTPSLDLHFVPAIGLSGNIGDTLRLDYINAIGPTDAWATLDTVTLTNTSQLYFDTSSIGQPRRLYRIVPGP